MIEVKLIGKPLVVGVSDEHAEDVASLKLDHIMNLISAEEYNREILELGDRKENKNVGIKNMPT